jgi:flagellar protein FlbD
VAVGPPKPRLRRVPQRLAREVQTGCAPADNEVGGVFRAADSTARPERRMIGLHRLTHPNQVVFVNSDLIQTVEATPDTVISLTNSSKLIVIEKPFEVIALIRQWRSSIVAEALERRTVDPERLAEIVHLAGSVPEPVGD